MSTYRTVEGDTVDLIAWRVYGAAAGAAEAILDANPGLADRGPELPAGVAVALPAAPAEQPAAQRAPRLWD